MSPVSAVEAAAPQAAATPNEVVIDERLRQD